MADVLHFNIDDALDQMMEVFWRQGFKSTTTKDLARNANISEGSFYNTFGSKHKAYLQTLDLYRQRSRRYIDLIEEADSPVEGLKEYWAWLAKMAASKSRPHVCMITNATVEMIKDEEVKSFVKSVHLENERRFKKILDKAVELGEIRPDTDTTALAQFFVFSAQGIRVMSSFNPSKRKLDNIVKVIMSTLDQHCV
ncbi:MAG: TetR/AcrR family transcriptional regulator [Pseudomonadales bacterium]|nr:TetR/AcrR family transcriptional regulator [Pseudomonadales bacterium]